MSKKCKQCKFFKRNIKTVVGIEKTERLLGDYTCPCGFFPTEISRYPEDRACGAFKDLVK